MQNLIYKEDDKMRAFISDSFTYVYDKDTNMTMSWGKTKEDTPLFNPIGPETVRIILDETYKFNEAELRKLFSVNVEDDEQTVSLASTVSTIIIRFKDDSCLKMTSDVQKLKKFFEDKGIFVSFLIRNTSMLELKTIIKMKTDNIKNVHLYADDFSEIGEKLSMFISNGIDVAATFKVTESNFEDAMNSLKTFPKLISCGFELHVDDEKSKVFVESLMKSEIADAFIKNFNEETFMKEYDAKTEEYDASLFSCEIDFINRKICPKFGECGLKPISIDNINNIGEYWNSTEFKKYRGKLLKKAGANADLE